MLIVSFFFENNIIEKKIKNITKLKNIYILTSFDVLHGLYMFDLKK